VWNRNVGGRTASSAADAATWLRAMDDARVETAVLFPTGGLSVRKILEAECADAVCRAYNDFFFDKFHRASPRLTGAALIPLQDVRLAAAELRRAVTELGAVTALLPALGPRRPLGHAEFYPLYEEAQRLDCLLSIHGVPYSGHYFVDLYDHFIDVHTVGFPVSIIMQLTNMIYRGVLEKFPKLRLAFLEGGCTWLPFFVERMDEEYEKRGASEAPILKQRPSDYVRSGRVFFSCEADESLLPEAVKLLGEDVIMYASDWPHWDSEFPSSIDRLKERKDLSEGAKQKILAENAKRAYRL
jgi:predicted TIM-barrel fold metal-dependent hydrolase